MQTQRCRPVSELCPVGERTLRQFLPASCLILSHSLRAHALRNHQIDFNFNPSIVEPRFRNAPASKMEVLRES